MPKIADFYAELGLKKDKFDQGMKDAEKAPNQLNESFRNLAIGIASAFSVGAILAFGKASMQAYNQEAKAHAGLLNALKGRKDIQEELIQQASELQSKTLFGDETTVEAQKQLAVMGLTKKQIMELIPLIQDFATSTGMDLAGAAMLVAKAVGTETNALGRYGVALDDTMSKTEKAAEIQRVFNERYGGQAEAAAKAGTGAIEQTSNAISDLSETIGKLLTTNTSGFFSNLTVRLTEMNNVLNSESIPAWRKFFGLVNYSIGVANKIQAEQFNRFQDGKNKELNARIENIDRIRQETAETLDQIDTLRISNAEKIKELNINAKNDHAKRIKEENEAREKSIKMANDLLTIQQELVNAPGSKVGDNLFTFDPDYVDMSMFDNLEIEPIKIPIEIQEFTNKLQEAKQQITDFMNTANEMMEGFVEDFVGTFAEGMGRMATGEMSFNQFFRNMLGAFGSYLMQFGKMLISYGIAWEAFKKAPGYAKIAAGIALVAIGAAISSLASRGVNESGGGGYGQGYGLTGTYGYGYGNSVPMGGYGPSGSNQFILTSEISGDDLRLIIEQSNRKTGRRY